MTDILFRVFVVFLVLILTPFFVFYVAKFAAYGAMKGSELFRIQQREKKSHGEEKKQ